MTTSPIAEGRPLRILLTADPELPVPPRGYGGIERIVDALVRAYRARGHTVALVAHRDSSSPADARFSWPGRHSGAPGDAIRNVFALQRAVNSFRPDVLHSFSRLLYLLPLLPRRLPKVMSYQRHTGGSQVHFAARMAASSLRFTGCSEYIANMGRASGGTWSAIHNFVEVGKFTFVPKVPTDAPLVFLSRIESIKGADTAIAIARAARRRLVLAGNHATTGPEAEYWRTQIAPEIGRDGIEWIGEVDDIRKNDLLGRAAALVVPIRWDEPFGIVFVESLACGTPVITCRRGASTEIVTQDLDGFFINSIDQGIAAVRRLDDLDRAACRKTAQEKFDATVATASYVALYRAMIFGSRDGQPANS